MHDNEIIEGIIAEFKGLAKHPRPSHHEKAVSDYIVSRLHELGVTDVIQDDVYNIVANVPATKGCESWPRTVLQGHMDMVCVAKQLCRLKIQVAPGSLFSAAGKYRNCVRINCALPPTEKHKAVMVKLGEAVKVAME